MDPRQGDARPVAEALAARGGYVPPCREVAHPSAGRTRDGAGSTQADPLPRPTPVRVTRDRVRPVRATRDASDPSGPSPDAPDQSGTGATPAPVRAAPARAALVRTAPARRPDRRSAAR